MAMELRDIEYFTVLAEQGSIGRAADILRLSQPAISKSLRRLEDALQVRLFRRSHRGIELTAEGSVLLARTRELRLSLQNIAREIAELGEGRVTHLRIGVGPSVPGDLLAAAFGKLLREAPRATMQVTVSDVDEILPALRKGDLDLILNIILPEAAPEGLSYLPLYDEGVVVCASATHRLAGRKKVSLADLSKERWASPPSVLPSHQRLRQVLEQRNFPLPQIAFESRSTWLRLQMVAASDLLLYTSRSAVRLGKVAGYPLTILPVSELVWRRPIGGIVRREGYLPPAVQRIIDILKSELAARISADKRYVS
jgi:DNA-binding transcriptional LysR family regulator